MSHMQTPMCQSEWIREIYKILRLYVYKIMHIFYEEIQSKKKKNIFTQLFA